MLKRESSEQTSKEIVDLLLNGKNVFLTSSGGKGKSWTIDQVAQILKQDHHKNVALIAPTGVAAANIRGKTIHSFFQLSPKQDEQPSWKFFNKKAIHRIGLVDVYIIDEISMCHSWLLDKILKRINMAKEKLATIDRYELDQHQVMELERIARQFPVFLFVGDFFQLPPVNCSNTEFAWNSELWKQCDPIGIELTKNMRAKNIEFAEVLDKIRVGQIDQSVVKSIYQMALNKDILNDDLTRLYGINSKAKAHNDQMLAKIKAKEHHFLKQIKMVDEFKHNDKDIKLVNKESENLSNKFEDDLVIKTGALIIMTHNLSTQIYNGLKGRVIGIKEDKELGTTTLGIYMFYDGEVKSFDELKELSKTNRDEFMKNVAHINRLSIPVKRKPENDYEYKLLDQQNAFSSINDDELTVGSILQYPVKLAYGLTVHKSQGMSITGLFCDLTNIFESGQAYVSISRATHQEKTFVLLPKDKELKDVIFASEIVKEFYANYEQNFKGESKFDHFGKSSESKDDDKDKDDNDFGKSLEEDFYKNIRGEEPLVIDIDDDDIPF